MQLKLTNTNLCADIDAEDLDKILQHSHCWRAVYNRKGRVTSVGAWSSIYGKSINLPTAILGERKGILLDHKDRNPLNNKKDNLRAATRRQNSYNSGPRTAKYKGVHFNKTKTSPWCVNIRYDSNKNYFKGGFNTPEEAAVHANEMYRKLHGEFAYQNTVEVKEAK
jgi:hypothetical protein